MILMTPRQKEVAKLVALGMTNKQVGKQLGISHHTVKCHLERVMLCLGAKNREEVAWQMKVVL